MSHIEASCPACGAPVTFKVGSSIVVVCDYCHSVVARGDRQLEDLGKVAEIMDTGSPLDVGLRGVYQGVPFELTGRAQLGHHAGGLWDEWYAAFADGRWGWLAEAQGRFYMTFQQSLPEQSLIPPFNLLELGATVAAIPGSVPFVVAEKGMARAVGAKGEIPYKLIPGEEYYYADLSGPRGEFATLDYSDMPMLLFIGREVTLAELGIAASATAPEREARRATALQISCPQCGGPLQLRAPDRTERVGCPNCGALLDANQGRLQLLKGLQPARVQPVIPIGAVGEFAAGQLTVIGFMQRSVEFDKRYYWEEYLLYNPQLGFRWLVRSDDHWSFVEPLPPGAVVDHGRTASFGGKRFKLYQDATARVEYVTGEFYWKVTVGELVRTADYIKPPQMLSKEVSTSAAEAAQSPARSKKKSRHMRAADTGEVNWSLGTYLKRREVEKIFGISGLPSPSTIAPNQPFAHKAIYKYWALLVAAMFVFGIVIFIITAASSRKVFENSYIMQPLANAEATHVIFTEPFELQGRKNIKVTARSSVDNSWLYVEGDLVDEATGLVQSFSMPIEYYHGVEDGESWSEGGNTSDVHLSALPPGRYSMRLEASWEKWQQAMPLNVKVEQGVPRIAHLVIALLLLSLVPLAVGIYHFSFEKRRWQDSDYSPFS